MLIEWHLSSCRCLKDGVADVAFLDHLRIMSATGNLKNAVFFSSLLCSFLRRCLRDMLIFLLFPGKIQSLQAVQGYFLALHTTQKETEQESVSEQ